MSEQLRIPTIETPQTILRAFDEDEARSLHAILSEPGVRRYFPSSNPPPLDRVKKLIKSQSRHWKDQGYGWWAVADRVDATLIGWCGLGFLEETEETEIKYLFRRSHWGRGIATETASVCLDYGYREVDLDTIIGLTHLENIASQRVLEKIRLSFRNQAEYFGMQCRRFTITREEFEFSRQEQLTSR
jgi:ribosomal-protein-alanine N-acetyltransferase